jgi:hypothetical protein
MFEDVSILTDLFLDTYSTQILAIQRTAGMILLDETITKKVILYKGIINKIL